MIINDTLKMRHRVTVLSDSELAEINLFLIEDFVPQLDKGEFVAPRNAYGGAKGDWSNIPLDILYRKNLARYNNGHTKAHAESAKALGYIIANLLRDLPERFEKDHVFKTWRYRLSSTSNSVGKGKSLVEILLPGLDNVSISEIAIDVDRCNPKPTVNGKRPSSPKKYDPKSDRAKKLVGDRGEEVVFKFEQERLKNLGLDASKVKHISKSDDSAGYDIESLDEHGNQILIEVKSTTRDTGFTEFIISDNEYSKAKQEPNYWIYLVFKAHTTTPKICRCHNFFAQNQTKIEMRPTAYKVTFISK